MREIETLVVGGGISGLATAWQLSALQNDVELWEAGSHIGGKIATDHDKGWCTERAASMVLNFRPEVSQFLSDTGLDNYKLHRTPTSKRYLIHKGELQEMPMKMAGMLFSPLWSLPGKLRLMLEPFVLKGAGENESVADFIRRRLGNEMLEKALGAYISGTLASDPERADSRAVLPHLTALEQRYGSLTSGVFARRVLNRKTASTTEGFSFQGGMSTLVNELSQQLGGVVRTQHKITHIERHARGWQVCATTPDGEQNCLVKKLILCTPAPVAATLLKSIQPELHALLADIRYAAVSVVHLGYARTQVGHAAEGTGFLTPFHEKLQLNGSMWMHSLFKNRAPDKHLLMSNYLGGARHPEVAHWNAQQKIAATCSDLKPLLKIKGDPVWARVDHHPNALPQYYGRYMLRQQSIQQQLNELPGLYLQANYLGGVSIRDRIICAQQLAENINTLPARKAVNSRRQLTQASPERT